MTDINDAIWLLLDQYLAGDCSADSAAIVREWLATQPTEHGALLSDVQRIRAVASQRPSMRSADVTWQELQQGLHGVAASVTQSTVAVAPMPRSRTFQYITRTKRWDWERISRHVLRAGRNSTESIQTDRLVATSVHWETAHQRRDVFSGQTWRQFGWTLGVTVAFAAMIFLVRGRIQTALGVTRVYATTVGQHAIVTLDDSTQVTLGPNTTIRLTHFGSASRTVALERGEAYFTVARATGVPFIVQSGGVATQVLGTEFFMQHNMGESSVRVGVANGKVRVISRAHTDTGITLTSGQIASITDSTAQVSSINDIVAGTAWAPGHLLFRNMPVPIILQTLSRWYGYQFCYADPQLAKQRLTIGISTQSSTEALATLEQVLLVNLVVAGDTVTLIPQSAHLKHGTPRTPRYDIWTPTREAGR